MNPFVIDFDFGENEEKRKKYAIDEFFNIKTKLTEQYCNYDYIDEDKKVIIELKTRRVNKDKYKDTMIPLNKIKKLLKLKKEGYKIYLCFCFLDGLFYYELKTGINENWVRRGGRIDRGKNEINDYYYIPIKNLKRII